MYSISRKNIGNIVLVDIIEGLAEGKCLDLGQSFPVDNINLKVKGTNKISEIEDSDAIIITAGIARKPGMSRDDLIETNFNIMKKIGLAIKEYSPKSFVICITNPLDAMVWCLKEISGIDKNSIVGMAGILDSSRFKFFLGQELNVSFENIQTMVLGGHGDTMVPLLEYTSISGIPIKKFIKKNKVSENRLNEIIERTRNGGGEVVSLLKESSAFFSPASSAIEMLESFIFDQKKILPCSAFLDGEYGINDLFVGVPVIIGQSGIEQIIELDLDEKSKNQFNNSVLAVEELINKCKKLLV